MPTMITWMGPSSMHVPILDNTIGNLHTKILTFDYVGVCIAELLHYVLQSTSKVMMHLLIAARILTQIVRQFNNVLD